MLFSLWQQCMVKFLQWIIFKKWNIIVTWYCMYKTDEESINHLRHWAIAKDLGSMVFPLFDISWIMPYSMKDLLACWRGGFKRHLSTDIWNATPLRLMWCIWKVCNSRSFDEIQSPLLHFKFFFLRLLFNWFKYIGDCSSFLEFLDLCDFRLYVVF